MNLQFPLIVQLSLITGLVLSLPVALTAGNYSACTNNVITLPGDNGPEIWSCVPIGNAQSQLAKVKNPIVTSDTNAEQQSAKTNEAYQIEPRTDASSKQMDDEIQRVLTGTKNKNRKRAKSFSIGASYSTNRKNAGLRDSRDRSFSIPLSYSFGLFEATEVSVSLPLAYNERELVTASNVRNADGLGISDASLNVSTDILPESGGVPGVSVNFGLGIPITDPEDRSVSNKLTPGSGFWSASAGATLSKRFDPATVFASVRYQHTFSETQFGRAIEPGNSIEYGYGLGLSLNNLLSIGGRVAGAIHRNTSIDGQTIQGTNSEPLQLMTTTTLRLKNKFKLESSLSYGLNRDANDAQLGFTITKEF